MIVLHQLIVRVEVRKTIPILIVWLKGDGHATRGPGVTHWCQSWAYKAHRMYSICGVCQLDRVALPTLRSWLTACQWQQAGGLQGHQTSLLWFGMWLCAGPRCSSPCPPACRSLHLCKKHPMSTHNVGKRSLMLDISTIRNMGYTSRDVVDVRVTWVIHMKYHVSWTPQCQLYITETQITLIEIMDI